MRAGITISIGMSLFCIWAFFVTGCGEEQKQMKVVKTKEKIKVASMPHSFTAYTVFIAKEKGFFQQEGLEVILDTSFPHGKATLEALSVGKVDFATSSETPFVRSVMAGNDLLAIAVTMTAESHLAVVGRKDLGIQAVEDLKGKKIGVTIGSNGEYFLDTFLAASSISSSAVTLVDVKPANMMRTIENGQVDAVATWNPIQHKIREMLGANSTNLKAGGLYSPLFLVSTNRMVVQKKPRTVEKMIKCLSKASEYIEQNMAESHVLVAQFLKTDLGFLAKSGARYNFKVQLPQSLFWTLETEAKWFSETKGGDNKVLPDFLDYISTDAMVSVAPKRVSIIR